GRAPGRHENTKTRKRICTVLRVLRVLRWLFRDCRSQRGGLTHRDGHTPGRHENTKTRKRICTVLRVLRVLRWLSRDHNGSVTASPLAKAFGFLPVNTSRCPPGSVTRRSRVFHGVSTGPTIATRPTGSASRARAASASTSP